VEKQRDPVCGKKASRKATEIINRRWLSKNAFELELSRPPDFDFKPGQTIQLIHQDRKRYYSLASGPGERKLTLCVNFIEMGSFSSFIAKAEIGLKLDLFGPCGYFTFTPSARPPVFIGTDTGVAPFVSMARSGLKGFTLLHGSGNSGEFYYKDVLIPPARKYVPVEWKENKKSNTPSGQFRCQMAEMLEEHLDPGRYDFYLCGWQKMIKDVIHLVDDRYPDSHLYTEVFT
jgi:ferredoxin-NADP reductase